VTEEPCPSNDLITVKEVEETKLTLSSTPAARNIFVYNYLSFSFAFSSSCTHCKWRTRASLSKTVKIVSCELVALDFHLSRATLSNESIINNTNMIPGILSNFFVNFP
jgi:hypothetical protein